MQYYVHAYPMRINKLMLHQSLHFNNKVVGDVLPTLSEVLCIMTRQREMLHRPCAQHTMCHM